MTGEVLEKTKHVIAKKQPFSESSLWELQQNYFAQRGVNAWRSGQVPHYVSSNPRLANSYAEIVIALWQDQQRLAFGTEPGEPIYIVELGAGSGRFAFHFSDTWKAGLFFPKERNSPASKCTK